MERGPGARDAPAHRGPAREPGRPGGAGGAARAGPSAAGRRTAGSRAGRSSDSAWPWPWSAAQGGVRRPAHRGLDPAGAAYDLEAARRAPLDAGVTGADHAQHGRGRAAGRPDPHHRPRPAHRLGYADRADPRRHRVDDPAGGDQALPGGRPYSLKAALGQDIEGCVRRAEPDGDRTGGRADAGQGVPLVRGEWVLPSP